SPWRATAGRPPRSPPVAAQTAFDELDVRHGLPPSAEDGADSLQDSPAIAVQHHVPDAAILRVPYFRLLGIDVLRMEIADQRPAAPSPPGEYRAQQKPRKRPEARAAGEG